jgi:hypothetical protein
MFRTTAATLAAVLFAACLPPEKDDGAQAIAKAIPTAEQVRIELPDNTARELGQIAPWYEVTRAVTRGLNGGTAWVLIVVHTVVQLPPTSVSGDTYTWGPWSGALDPAEYKLDVTAVDDGSYDWQLSGRSKTESNAVFEVVIGGNAVPGETEGTGHGNFTIDYDASERVNPVDTDARGVIEINYDLAARHLDMAVATYENRDGIDTPVNYDYSYDRSTDGSGNMMFAVHADTDDAGALAEDAVLRSRWQNNGEGRADIRLSSGDLADAMVTASECWNDQFRRVYYADSLGITVEGDVADCVYADADLPPL